MRSSSAAHRAGGPDGGMRIVGGNQAILTQRDPWCRGSERWSLVQQSLFAAVRRGEPAAELDRILATIKVEHRMRRDARALSELAEHTSHRLDIPPTRVLLVADAVRDALLTLEIAA